MVADRTEGASGWKSCPVMLSCAPRPQSPQSNYQKVTAELYPMPYKDMREFLDVLEKDGQLKSIDVPIKAAHGDNELQALMRLLCQNEGPAALLNNLEGYNTPEIPVIFNPFGTR